jgi:V8-like Glu-specific endopeptidase
MGGRSIEEFPFVGQLVMHIPGCNFDSKCTGTILSSKFIITAKHCLYYNEKYAHEKCPNLAHMKNPTFDSDRWVKSIRIIISWKITLKWGVVFVRDLLIEFPANWKS